MRSGGFHQRISNNNRYHSKRPRSRKYKEERMPTRKQFVKKVLSSGVRVYSPDPQEIRDSIIELKKVLPSVEKPSKEESALLGVDPCGAEPPTGVNGGDFNESLRGQYPHIARMISNGDKDIAERYDKPNPLEIIGYSEFIVDKVQRDKVVQSALALAKGLEELASTHAQDGTPPVFSPPSVQEEIDQKIRATKHYKSEALAKYRYHLKRFFAQLQQAPPLFERKIIGDLLIRRLQKLEEWLIEEGYIKKEKRLDPSKPPLSPQDKQLLYDSIIYLHLADEGDAAVIVLTRDNNILRAIKAIHDEEPWYGNGPLAGFNNLEKFYAATIDSNGSLVFVVGPKGQDTNPKPDQTTSLRSYYNSPWRLPDYIRRQQQQKLEQLID